MIGVEVTVPIACWRKPYAMEFIETEIIPSPAMCYGCLLSLVGETNRYQHIGAKITCGLFNRGNISTVLRTIWRLKDKKVLPGEGQNKRLDRQQIVINSHLIIWVDSSEENKKMTLEYRVKNAMKDPNSVSCFGGWSLGESFNLINDAYLREQEIIQEADTFLLDTVGNFTFPIWVDHCGTLKTKYVRGSFRKTKLPSAEFLPKIANL
jgi:CRISPR-associated protein Cas5t